MKLYYSPGACSQATRISLLAAGLPFEAEKVDLRKHVTETGADYYTINPKGPVPALQIDGEKEVLTENFAILLYVASKAPKGTVAPDFGTPEYWRFVEILAYLNSEFHKAIGTFFVPKGPEEHAAALAILTKKLEFLEKSLEGKEYLVGGRFSSADAYLFVLFGWSGYLKLDVSTYKNLLAHQARVGALDFVKTALAQESGGH